MYRGGLDRFKKAQTVEPFSVALSSNSKAAQGPSITSVPTHLSKTDPQIPLQEHIPLKSGETGVQATQVTQVGGGQSTWQPPDWAIEPRPGVHYLEVLKDGEILGQINLDKRKHIFGRQFPMCDFVLDHQSVSRQHAAVVPHKNGSIYVIDLGSAHGTFVANERLIKEMPMELEAGQSLRFAASTRTYVLRKNKAALFPTPAVPAEIKLPPPPDASDEEAVLAYNTLLNRFGLNKPVSVEACIERPAKRSRKLRVAFKDQVGGDLIQIVGISDGADVDTEPGPIGVKEGSLVGKYESLVQVTVIPKGKEQISPKEDSFSPKGVTDKLQQVLNKVKSVPKVGIYDDLYGDSFSGKVGSSWAYKADSANEGQNRSSKGSEALCHGASNEKMKNSSAYDSDDDLFGDDDL